MDDPNLRVKWLDSGHEPTQKPDPAYPHGFDVDVSRGAAMTCATSLPYPARRVGSYIIDCLVCGARVMCTTAGRVDDPRSIKIACRKMAGNA